MNNLQALRETLNPTDVINILSRFDVKPVYEGATYTIFPTVCHNVNGGSAKLYYYHNSKLFKCFTECDGVFDIFTLIVKMFALQNKTINSFQAAELCGLKIEQIEYNDSDDLERSLSYWQEFNHTSYEILSAPEVNRQVLDRYVFSKDILALWEQEGITLSTMRKYKIGYDPIANCITIPIFDHRGRLVSVRGRYLDENAEAKYKPVTYENQVLNAPSSILLYGLWQTRNAIKKSKTAILFESEKSVLMMDSYYGNNNNSVATLGKNISKQHIQLLKKCGADNVILAYDADYRTYAETEQKFYEYQKIAKNLAPFFTTSILIDWKHLLPYKASPIDCGKDIFEQLMENQTYVEF